jgi:hypothetical protein
MEEIKGFVHHGVVASFKYLIITNITQLAITNLGTMERKKGRYDVEEGEWYEVKGGKKKMVREM